MEGPNEVKQEEAALRIPWGGGGGEWKGEGAQRETDEEA